jgi:hypothetical protein
MTTSMTTSAARRVLSSGKVGASSFLPSMEPRTEFIGRLVPHVSTSKAKEALRSFTRRVIAGKRMANRDPCQCLATAKANVLERLGEFDPLIRAPHDDVTANGIVHDLAGHRTCTGCPSSRTLEEPRAERVVAYLGESAGREWVTLAEGTRRLRDERAQGIPEGYTRIPLLSRDATGALAEVEAFHTTEPHLMHTITPQAMSQWVLANCKKRTDDFEHFFSCNHKLCISVADPNAEKPLLYGIEDRIAFLIHLDPSGIITTGVCDQLSPVGRMIDSYGSRLGDMRKKIEHNVKEKLTAISERKITQELADLHGSLSVTDSANMLIRLRRRDRLGLNKAITVEVEKQYKKQSEEMQAYLERMPTIVNYKKFMAEITAVQSYTRYYIRQTIEKMRSSHETTPELHTALDAFERREAESIAEYMRNPLASDGYATFLDQLRIFKEIYLQFPEADEQSATALSKLIVECEGINEIIDAHAPDIVLLHARDRGDMSAYFVDKTPEQLRQLARAMIPPTILSPSQLNAGVQALPEGTAAEVAIKHTEVDVWSRQCSFGGVYIPRHYLQYDEKGATIRETLPDEKRRELADVLAHANRLGLPILIPQPPMAVEGVA